MIKSLLSRSVHMSNNGSNDQGPWGKRPEQGPPDLLELIKKMFSGNKQGAGNSSPEGGDTNQLPLGKIIAGVIGLFVVIWVLAGIFVVKPAEQAVILRFGKYIETTGAGPHWIPPLIDKRFVINTQEVRNFPYNAEMLTRDENIVSVSVAVQYRIDNPSAFLFAVVNPIRSLQQATSSALRQVVGQMRLDDVLTIGRQELRDRVAKQLNKVLSIYKSGLEVTDLTLQPAKPPEEVTEAFDDAIKAREDEQRYINQAEAYVRKVTATAVGQIARLIQSANAYQQEVVLRAKGHTARFMAMLSAYKNAPKVTHERLYFDSMQSVLSKTHNVIMDASHGNLLYLPLNKILQQDKAEETQSNSDKEKTTATATPDETPFGSREARPIFRPSYPEGVSQ